MIMKLYGLACNSCGRSSTSRGFANTGLARAAAKRDGWQRSPTNEKPVKDWCPRCVGRGGVAR